MQKMMNNEVHNTCSDSLLNLIQQKSDGIIFKQDFSIAHELSYSKNELS
jgi:hypothetical protein